MPKSSHRVPSVAAIRQAFHRVGLRPSAASRALVQFLAVQRAPLRCADIIRKLAPYGFEESTFPRLLERLQNAGLVLVIRDADGGSCFALDSDRLRTEPQSLDDTGAR